ncbi:MAG: replicative DNA helicase [Candidatus Ratteibacteria bacterium]|nr:replicative DNA helicase [Candidatus Ratteibacteria bacterium]
MAGKEILSKEKLPPQNLEAEMSVLGCMLLEEDAIGRAVEILSPQSFYKDGHQKIFAAILDLYERREAIDLITLTAKLKKLGQLDEVAGAAYLTSLINSVPTSAHLEYYAKIVKEKSLLRHLINTATRIITESYESAEDTDILLDRAEQMIFEIAQRRIEQTFTPLKEVLKDSFEVIEDLYNRKEHITGVPSGFKDLDNLTTGFQAGDLVVIASRPAMGKTSLCMNIVQHVAVEKKIPVAFFSLEMSKEQLVQRMLWSESRVNGRKLLGGFLGESAWPKLTIAAGRLSEASIFIDDSAAISVLELRAKARRLKTRQDIKLIIVDYLQLMQGRGKTENRQQEISEISRSLKSLAKELNLPVVGISQLSRAVEGRQNRRPQLSDLRESGAIEQDADLVAFIYREEYYTPTEDNKGIAEIIIGKQRNGPTGTVKLAFIEDYARFENLVKMGG